MTGTTPSQPGWYPDGDGGERWYDGNGWTDHVRGAPTNESTVVVPPPTPGTGELPQVGPQAGGVPPPAGDQLAASGQLQIGRGLRIALAVGAVLVVIAMVGVGAIVLLGGDEDNDKGSDQATSPSTSEAAPTDPATTPDFPTLDPSDFPSINPSDFPTPSVEVPDLPTELPTGFPTDFPSEFPTDQSGWDSWHADQLEQLMP